MAKCTACGSPLCAGCGSPNKYKSPLELGIGGAIGAAIGGSSSGIERLQSMLAQEAAVSQPGVMPVDPSLASAGITPTPPPVTGGDTNVKTNPFADQKFKLTPVQMTYEPPTPANMKGNSKPLFSEAVNASAEAIYGTPEQRQMSVPGAAMFMKDIPEGDKGAGLRKLPDNVVEKMGYDAATKMVSPLNQEGPGLKKALEVGANILTGGAYNAAKNLLGKNKPQENFLPTKVKTNMPKKRANGGHPGYVVDLSGNRITTETISQAQDILKRKPQNIFKKK